MNVKRGLRDILIFLLAALGTFLIIFGRSLVVDSSGRIFVIVVGVLLIIVALAISLSRFLIK